MTATSREAVEQVEKVASSAFASGFFSGDELREDMRTEVPVRLMYALRQAGVARWQLDALVLALRDSAESDALNLQAPLTAQQARFISDVMDEDDLPVAFRGLLGAAKAKLHKQQDLVALYAVINNVIGKWDTMAQLLHMNPDDPEGGQRAPT